VVLVVQLGSIFHFILNPEQRRVFQLVCIHEKLLFMSCVSDLLFIPQMTHEYGAPWWNDTDKKKPNKSEKSQSHFHIALPTLNSTWTDPSTNPGFFHERSSTNHLSHGTGYEKLKAVRVACLDFLL
jgi:hypothetical protein